MTGAVQGLVPALLAAAALACLLGLPRRSASRLQAAVGAGAPGRPRSAPHAPRRPGPVVVARGAVLAGAALLTAATLVVGVVPALLAAAGAGLAERERRRRTRSAARRQERASAVEACSVLAAELRAGRAPAEALAAAAGVASGPCRTALHAAAGASRLGGDTAAALRPPEGTAVADVLGSLAACWTVCAGSGGGLAAAAERLEEGLRADQAQRRAVEAELAGPRATAGLLAVLPAGGLLLAGGLGADPLHVLLHTPVGLVCLTLGLALDGLGLAWTGRLVRRAGGQA